MIGKKGHLANDIVQPGRGRKNLESNQLPVSPKKDAKL